VRVLLAEDSGVIRILLKQVLTKWGYEIVFAEDGDQAWAVLERSDSPRIALLDWMMPGPDGLEVCQRVRKAAREPRVYIILLTGKDQQADVVRGLAAGADDYLRKPFDNAELEARMRTGRRIVELEDELVKVREALRACQAKDEIHGRVMVPPSDRGPARRGPAKR
jgi:two-component system, cell cycle response regulator